MADSAANPQTKVNRLVFECLQKAVEIIVLSRVQNEPHASNVGERNWFQLNIEGSEHLRQQLRPWGSSIHEPLQLDILADGDEQTLVERWNIHYLPRQDIKTERMTAISKKMSIFVRTLYSYVRMLPAFQGGKKRPRHNYQFHVYNPSLKLDYANQEFSEGEVGYYTFPSLSTPYGHFQVKSRYLRDKPLQSPNLNASAAIPIGQNMIIPDYIPNYLGPSRFTTAEPNPRRRSRSRSTSVDSTGSSAPSTGTSAPSQPPVIVPQDVPSSELKRAATVGPDVFSALTRRHSMPVSADNQSNRGNDDGMTSAVPATPPPSSNNQRSESSPTVIVPLNIAGKARSFGRLKPQTTPPIPIPEHEPMVQEQTGAEFTPEDNSNNNSQDPWSRYFGEGTPPNVRPLGRPHARSLDASPFIHTLLSQQQQHNNRIKAETVAVPNSAISANNNINNNNNNNNNPAHLMIPDPMSSSPMQAPYGVLPQMNRHTKDLAFAEGSPSLVSALPDPTDAIVSSSPPYPKFDCTLLSTSPQTPGLPFAPSHMNKFLTLSAAQNYQAYTKGTSPNDVSLAPINNRRINETANQRHPDAPALDIHIPALPDNPFDMMGGYTEKESDPNSQLPFAAEGFGGAFDVASDYGDGDNDHNDEDVMHQQAPFAPFDEEDVPCLSIANDDAFKALSKLWERRKFRSFERSNNTNNTDTLVLEDQLQELRSFRESLQIK